MALITRQSSTFKLQFVFGFNECLWGIFSLLSLGNFWFYLRVAVLWLLILQGNCDSTSSPQCPWIKSLGATTTKYIPKCWERSNLKSESEKINLLMKIFYILLYIPMVQTFLKLIWWQFLVPYSERRLISNTTLLGKT